VTLGWLGWLTFEVFKIVIKLKMSTSKRQMMVMRKSVFYTIMRLRDLSGYTPEHNPLAVAMMVYVRPALWGRPALRHQHDHRHRRML
jgi:hypothetical protein